MLSEHLVPLTLFGDDRPVDMNRRMATALNEAEEPTEPVKRRLGQSCCSSMIRNDSLTL